MILRASVRKKTLLLHLVFILLLRLHLLLLLLLLHLHLLLLPSPLFLWTISSSSPSSSSTVSLLSCSVPLSSFHALYIFHFHHRNHLSPPFHPFCITLRPRLILPAASSSPTTSLSRVHTMTKPPLSRPHFSTAATVAPISELKPLPSSPEAITASYRVRYAAYLAATFGISIEAAAVDVAAVLAPKKRSDVSEEEAGLGREGR